MFVHFGMAATPVSSMIVGKMSIVSIKRVLMPWEAARWPGMRHRRAFLVPDSKSAHACQ